ncbi:MAG: MFS transporter [Candidatus Thorarchaeota archaeon]
MEVIPNRRTYGLYFCIWGGHLASLFGSITLQFALIWWLTREITNVSLISLANFFSLIPAIVLTIFVGVLIDRYDRRMLMLAIYTLKGIFSIILLVIFLIDFVSIATIFTFLTLMGILLAFESPTMMAITPSMVPKNSLGRVNGIDNQVLGIVQIISIQFAFTIFTFFPLKFTFWLEVVTTIIALIPLIFIKIPKVYAKPRLNSYFKELGIGFRILIKIPGLFIILLILVLMSFLLQPLYFLMPLYILFEHNSNTIIYSLIDLIIPTASFFGALIPIIKRNWKRKTLVIFISVITLNVGYLIFSLAPYRTFPVLILALFVIGFTLPLIQIFTIAIFQTAIPKNKMGRFSSIYLTISIALTSLTPYLFGPIGAIFRISTLFLICALIGIVIGIATFFLTSIRHNKFDLEYELNLS